MILYVKLGTMPGQMMKLLGKRKAPVVGDFFDIRDPKEKYAKPIHVRCTEIRNIGDQNLYFLDRM